MLPPHVGQHFWLPFLSNTLCFAAHFAESWKTLTCCWKSGRSQRYHVKTMAFPKIGVGESMNHGPIHVWPTLPAWVSSFENCGTPAECQKPCGTWHCTDKNPTVPRRWGIRNEKMAKLSFCFAIWVLGGWTTLDVLASLATNTRKPVVCHRLLGHTCLHTS